MPTTAGAPPGSGKNFAALKAKLAARGAHDPGALAAYIGRRKYGRKAFGKMSHHQYSNVNWSTVDLAGDLMRCPNCGYNADSAEFDTSGGVSGTSVERQPDVLRTPAPGGNSRRAGFIPEDLTVRTGSGGANAISGFANDGHRDIRLARGTRAPVRTSSDIVVTRSPTGTAIIRHRQGGDVIGEVGRGPDGAWRSLIDSQELSPHTHQRAALQELLGAWNRTAADPSRPAMPLSSPPPQPSLLSELGISNVRAFASQDGDSDDDDSPAGDTDKDYAGNPRLTPKGQAVYRKLRARGIKQDTALKMALRAQDMSAGSFSKAG